MYGFPCQARLTPIHFVFRNGVNIPEPTQPQPQPQPPAHESGMFVDNASISSEGTHSIPDQFYQTDMASGSVEIDTHVEKNSGGNTPGSSDVSLNVSCIGEPNDDPSDGSLSRLAEPGEQHGKHTGHFADAAPRTEHSIKEREMNQSKQPVGHRPANETPAKEPTELDQTKGSRTYPELLELYEVTDNVLGKGTFATVKEIKRRSTGQAFALKIILKKNLEGNETHHLGQVMDVSFGTLATNAMLNIV